MTLRELLKQNELHFPLMRIPYHTSLSEISFMRYRPLCYSWPMNCTSR